MNGKHESSLGETVSRTFLTYLNALPCKLLECKPDSQKLVGDACLSIGNCLLWMQPHIEPGSLHHEEPVGYRPSSVWSLGKQFRASGLAMMDGRKPDTSQKNVVRRIEMELAKMQAELNAIREEQYGVLSSKPSLEFIARLDEGGLPLIPRD